MATTNKDFRIKNGLVVEGATSTVNGNQVLTTASSLDSLSDVVITTPTTSQVLLYNGTNWINSTPSGGGTTTNALTIGTGLSGTSFNGSAAVTIAIDSTVATTSGSQTLTNKTINLSSNTLTATSAQIASAVTDETGSGALVFGTSPTIGTPLLTLSTTSSTTDGRIAWDSTNDKILVGGTLNSVSQAVEFASSTLTISTPTFTTNAYTVVLTDKDKWLELSNGATAGTLNIPTDATANFAIGTQLNIIQTGAGQITIAAVTPGTTTVNGTPGLKLRAQWSAVTIVKRAANSWVAVGDLSA